MRTITLRQVCSWCGAKVGEKTAEVTDHQYNVIVSTRTDVSHSICQACKDKMMEEAGVENDERG